MCCRSFFFALPQRKAKASRPRFGGGTRPASLRPRKEGKLAGCGSGVGRDQQVSGPARRESLLVADRGWDVTNKSLTPQVAVKHIGGEKFIESL